MKRARAKRGLHSSRLALIGLLAVAYLQWQAACAPALAHACGLFFVTRAEERPSLAHEQVVLMHDATHGKQHFIRRVTFREAREPFGFVVPTPTRPEVSAIEHDPFQKLRSAFRFESRPPAGEGIGKGFGSGHGRLGGGVQVLEVKELGSFTAFVLAATDERALHKWLADHRLISTKETDAWLAHYVAMGFHYVALRYNPTELKGQNKKHEASARAQPSRKPITRTQTLRISFDTPLPYYPYFEPRTPEGVTQNLRLLELWFVSQQAVTPIALHETAGTRRWVRPLQPGQRVENARSKLVSALHSVQSLLGCCHRASSSSRPSRIRKSPETAWVTCCSRP
jgi:hypothetical protein